MRRRSFCCTDFPASTAQISLASGEISLQQPISRLTNALSPRSRILAVSLCGSTSGLPVIRLQLRLLVDQRYDMAMISQLGIAF